MQETTLRVQVPNNHILTQNLYYNYDYPNPTYLNISYMDPLGKFFLRSLAIPRLQLAHPTTANYSEPRDIA